MKCGYIEDNKASDSGAKIGLYKTILKYWRDSGMSVLDSTGIKAPFFRHSTYLL